MDTLSALLDRNPVFKPVVGHERNVENLITPLHSAGSTRPISYEDEVFNFLLANKDLLGIKSVCKFTNLLLDGQIVLTDRRRLVIEIKLRMNWLKACQAEWQFRQFLKRRRYEEKIPLSGGIVFFESFTSDWSRPVGGIIRGWKHWSLYHSEIDGLRVNLLQFRDQKLEGCPLQVEGRNRRCR
jgi:hypothetical protein